MVVVKKIIKSFLILILIVELITLEVNAFYTKINFLCINLDNYSLAALVRGLYKCVLVDILLFIVS